MNPSTQQIIFDGLWKNNPGFVQLLGLCPLLAVSNSVINALGLGIATTLTLVLTNLLVSISRKVLIQEIRIPIFVLIIASVVTAIEMLMNAFLHDLYRVLGIFIPLIVTNCMIIGRAEAFASRNTPRAVVIDAIANGCGFTLVLVLVGGLREILGHATLFAHADMLFGETARHWKLQLLSDYPDFLFALLPPGAFICLGILIALKNLIDTTQMKCNEQRETNRNIQPVAKKQP